jgi:ABC-type transport system involved in multi-copper enzyme maturation permease subunit
MIVLKSTKFHYFSKNGRTVFKVSSQIYLDIIHYKKIKWICVEIQMMHILHQIHADIYIFNKIFNEHKLAQL